MTARRVGRVVARALALAAYAALLLATAPAWPDDWDGIGFAQSVRAFDLARFRPHPPGYPVYVALLRVAAAFVGDPWRACLLVGAVSGAVAIAFAWSAVRWTAGERAAWLAALLVAVAPGVWRACSGVGTEAPALACAAACAWGLAAAATTGCAPRWLAATALGVGAGLGLGVRLSWSPLYVAALALAAPACRRRAWVTAAAVCAAWAVPFVATVGAANLVGLYAAHFSGHAARWGGTIVTEPGFVRVLWVARDVFVDGLGVGADPLGFAIGALVAIASIAAVVRWRAARWRGWRTSALLVVPYLLWIGLAQNLRDQPRHALPLVALFAAALAFPVAQSRAAVAIPSALALLVSVRTADDSRARRTIPPTGQQLVDLVRAQPSPTQLTVFGVASLRFFETTDLASRAEVADSLGEAHMALTRFPGLPARVWVTSEVAGLEDPGSALTAVATLCRPPRLARARPCLGVYELALNSGRAAPK